MTIAQSMLHEFDHEMANTRRVLANVPEAKADWQPHDKSMSLSKLALHVATLPDWTGITFSTSELDVAKPWDRPTFTTTAALLAQFDDSVVKARAALANASDAEMMMPWSLKAGEQVIFTLPKLAVMRSFVMNHLIHHRAQLTVYLRLCNVPVPGMYGPSADEM